MPDYIQIGVTALRDPMTGEPLEAVPLYIRAGDRESQEKAEIHMGPLAREWAAAMKDYLDGTRE